MADILIVCVREDEQQAKSLAEMFERAGFSVGGAPGNDAALRSSGAAVVVWSQASIRSRPFLDAAQRVVSADKAVLACLIEPPPGESVKHAPAFDLSGWIGDPDDPILDPLFFAVDRLISGARASVGAAPMAAAAPASREDMQLPRALRSNKPAAPPYARPARTAPPEARQAPPATLPPGFQMRSPQPPERRIATTPPGGGAANDPLSSEAAHWRAIRHSTDPTEFLDYLNKWGSDSSFAELAQLRLRQLEGGEAPPQLRSPARAPLSAPPARSYDPPPVRREAPMRRELPPVERDFAVRSSDGYTREFVPRKSGGGAFRIFILLLLFGGAAVAGGVYLGLGDDALKLLSQAGIEAGSSEPENVEATPPVGEPADTAASDAGLAPSSLDEVVDDAPLADAPARSPTSTARPQTSPTRADANASRQPTQTRVAANTTRSPAQTRSAAQQNDGPTPAPMSWTGSGGQDNGPASLMPGTSNTSPSTGGSTFSATGLNSNAPASSGPVSLRAPGETGSAPASTAATTPASATTTAQSEARLSWAHRPSAQSISALYPRSALRDGQSGYVTLDCAVRTDLALSCTVASESPQGEGFGRAALDAAREYRANAAMSDGTSAIGSHTRLQINFRAPRN